MNCVPHDKQSIVSIVNHKIKSDQIRLDQIQVIKKGIGREMNVETEWLISNRYIHRRGNKILTTAKKN